MGGGGGNQSKMLQDMSSVASSALVGALVEAKLDELSYNIYWIEYKFILHKIQSQLNIA